MTHVRIQDRLFRRVETKKIVNYATGLRSMRIKVNLGVRELARIVNVSAAYISQVEKKRIPISTPIMKSITKEISARL